MGAQKSDTKNSYKEYALLQKSAVSLFELIQTKICILIIRSY